MATNPARKETDSLLEELEKRIAKEYEQAADELTKKADKYFAGFAERDKAKLALVNSGKLSQEEYLKWRSGAMMYGKRYTEMINDLTNTAVNADKAAMAIVNGSLPETFRINANYGAYEVERATGIDTSFTLYNKDAVADLIKNQPDLLPKPKVDIPLDKRWNRQHLNSAITQGILQGDSIDSIAKRLRSVANMDKNAAVRNARTMTTAAENAGIFHSYERAEKMGIKGQKMWMATHDSRTRDSHAMIDGETRNLQEKFSNDMLKPGDVEGRPEERYNCRCRIVYVSNRSQLKQYYDEQNKKVVIDGKSYDEWKQESYDKWEKRHEQAAQISSRTIDNCKNFSDIKEYFNGKYGISIMDSVKDLEFDGVKSALGGVESVMNRWDAVKGQIESIGTRNSGYMASDGYRIYFNPTYFQKGVFNGDTGYAYLAGAHEAGHIADMLLCLQRHPGDKWGANYAFFHNEVSQEIVRNAVKEVKKYPQWKNLGARDIRRSLSNYATSDTAETVAEAVGHYTNWERMGRVDEAMKHPGGQLAKKILEILEERLNKL